MKQKYWRSSHLQEMRNIDFLNPVFIRSCNKYQLPMKILLFLATLVIFPEITNLSVFSHASLHLVSHVFILCQLPGSTQTLATCWFLRFPVAPLLSWFSQQGIRGLSNWQNWANWSPHLALWRLKQSCEVTGSVTDEDLEANERLCLCWARHINTVVSSPVSIITSQMSDYSTQNICSGIKAFARLWSTVHALVNQINLKMTSRIIKSRARTRGRDPDSQKISVDGFMGFVFAIHPPPGFWAIFIFSKSVLLHPRWGDLSDGWREV